LHDELARWSRAFESVEPEYRGDHDAVRRDLLVTMPAVAASAVCHGDFRLGNLMCVGPAITAVIDWEIWSRTDPRLDLTWMLWISDAGHPSSVGPVDGMPSGAELMAAYLDAGGWPADPDELRWFRAMTCYKQAASVALLAKHGRRRQDGTAEGFERLTPLMVGQARAILDGQESAG
jgi:aminoglycoside phosphotransferase (APT) family kinase protein